MKVQNVRPKNTFFLKFLNCVEKQDSLFYPLKKKERKQKEKKRRPLSYLRSEQARFLTLSDIFCRIIIYLRPNMQTNTRPYYVTSYQPPVVAVLQKQKHI